MLSLERQCPTAAHWTEQQYRELFAGAESHVRRLALVAESALEPGSDTQTSGTSPFLGFLIACQLAPEWELENIVVEPAARRQGAGKRLLKALLDTAQETNSESVFLEVRESNLAGRALYEQLGFREIGRRKSYYKSPLEDAVLYSLTLR
jgi:[ribosomal protein S18]-alanine N-acetyltransferase